MEICYEKDTYLLLFSCSRSVNLIDTSSAHPKSALPEFICPTTQKPSTLPSQSFPHITNQHTNTVHTIMSSITKPRILFFNPVRHALENFRKLSSVAQTEVLTSKSRAEFFNECKGKYKDIVAIYSTSSSCAVTGKFDKELVQNLPSSLKFICHNGAGKSTAPNSKSLLFSPT